MTDCIYTSSKPPCENAIKLIFMVRNFTWTNEELKTLESIIQEKITESNTKQNE